MFDFGRSSGSVRIRDCAAFKLVFLVPLGPCRNFDDIWLQQSGADCLCEQD